MPTRQPSWRLLANLGDVDPIEYGGFFVYEDTTGVHGAEAELVVSPEDDDDEGTWYVYRFLLDRCTFIDGVLSDNSYHPELSAWFADSLSDVARFSDTAERQLITWLCSENAIERAEVYRSIGDYHGFENFDSYPLQLTREEVTARLENVSA